MLRAFRLPIVLAIVLLSLWLVFAPRAQAQSTVSCPNGYTQLTWSNITDGAGNALATGTGTITPEYSNGEQIGVVGLGSSSGGGITRKPVKVTVVNGVLQSVVGSTTYNGVCIADSTKTSPYVLYHIQIRDSSQSGSQAIAVDADGITLAGSTLNLNTFSWPGPGAPAPNIFPQVGNVQTLAPGSPAQVTITTPGNTPTFNFAIPSGQNGTNGTGGLLGIPAASQSTGAGSNTAISQGLATTGNAMIADPSYPQTELPQSYNGQCGTNGFDALGDNNCGPLWANDTRLWDQRGYTDKHSWYNAFDPLSIGTHGLGDVRDLNTFVPNWYRYDYSQDIGASNFTPEAHIFHQWDGGHNNNNSGITGATGGKSNLFGGLYGADYYGRGQHYGLVNWVRCMGIGDCLLNPNFEWTSNGCANASDECNHWGDSGIIEDPYVTSGTINTASIVNTTVGGIHGSTSMKITLASGSQMQPGDGRVLIDLTQASCGLIGSVTDTTNHLCSGNTITAGSTGNSTTHIATFTGVANSWTPSTANTTLTQMVPNATGQWSPGSVTVTVTSSSGFTAGLACIADADYFEEFPITATASGTITATFAYPHLSGAVIYQGGECGNGLVLNSDVAAAHAKNGNKNVVRQVWPVVGSASATLYYWAGVGNFQAPINNGIASPYLATDFGNATASSATLAYDLPSNTVTVTNCSQCGFQQWALGRTAGNPTAGHFPNLQGLTLTVSGSSDATLNGTTGPITIISPTSFSYTPVTSPTGSESNISIALAYCNCSYTEYPMAEVMSVYNSTTRSVDGTLLVGANNVAWQAAGTGTITAGSISGSGPYTASVTYTGSTPSVGGTITITGAGSAYNVTSVPILSVTGSSSPYSITYTANSAGSSITSGTVTLLGDLVEVPHHFQMGAQPGHNIYRFDEPVVGEWGEPGVQYQDRVTGQLDGWSVNNAACNNSVTCYLGFGGTDSAPERGYYLSGWWHDGFYVNVAPEDAVFYVGCKPGIIGCNGVNGTGWNAAYHIFKNVSYPNAFDYFDYNPYTGNYSFTDDLSTYSLIVGGGAVTNTSGCTSASPCSGVQAAGTGSMGSFVNENVSGTATLNNVVINGTCTGTGCGGSSSAGGSTGQVQVNSGTGFTGYSGLTETSSTVGIGGSGYTNTVTGATNINTTGSAGTTQIGNTSNVVYINASQITETGPLQMNGGNFSMNPNGTASSGTPNKNSYNQQMYASVYDVSSACSVGTTTSLVMSSATAGYLGYGSAQTCNSTAVTFYDNLASGIFSYIKSPSQVVTANISGTTAIAGGTNVTGTWTSGTTHTDATGSVQLVTSASISSGATLGTLTFGATWPSAPNCVFSAANASAIGVAYGPAASTTTFTWLAGTTIASGTTLNFTYHCQG